MIHPFENEEESMQIARLVIENRTDRISIYGDIDIRCDQVGLEQARQLQQLFEQIVTKLQAKNQNNILPEQVDETPASQTTNPFE